VWTPENNRSVDPQLKGQRCPWTPEVVCGNKCGSHMLMSIFHLILQHSHLATAGMNINPPAMGIHRFSACVF